MKNIKTLVQDIYGLFDPKTHIIPKEEDLETFAINIKNKLREKLAEVNRPPALRMSNLGTRCNRQLWYKINTPGRGESLRPSTYIKFLFGDLIEELLLFLARTSGHAVQDEQKEVSINSIKGRCDAVIDGVLVDVKSASPRAFTKFEEGLNKDRDDFGYLTQLGLYKHTLEKDRAAFIAFDKVSGEIVLDEHKEDLEQTDYKSLVEFKKEVIALPEPPLRFYTDVEEGKSGNRKLGVACSYCEFKKTCWPGLRTFLYYNGPVYLTHVERTPNVPEA